MHRLQRSEIPKTKENPKVDTFRDIAKYWLKGVPDMFQAWILFCLQHTKKFIGAIMQQSTENQLTKAEMAAYDVTRNYFTKNPPSNGI